MALISAQMPSPLVESEAVLAFAGLVTIVYLAAVTIGRYLKRRQGVRLGVSYQFFCIALALWVPLLAFDRLIGVQPGWEWLHAMLTHLGTAVALFGTIVFLSLLRRFYWELWYERTNNTKAPRFISEVIGLLIFVAVMLGVSRILYPQMMTGLALGSTVVAAIVGFALQDLLGNLIAGISLELGKPFRTGDWLIIDNQRAEVIEVNWRSTRLRTNDDVYFDLPNKLIVSSRIVNLTYPTHQHAVRLQVGFEYGTPPNIVKDCLARAALGAQGVLKNPAPKVYLKDFAESAITYEIKFWIEDEPQYNNIMDAVRTNIWYEAHRNRLRIPYPIRTLHIERKNGHHHDDSMETARACVRKQPFFQLLEEDQIDHILRHSRALRFGRGEKIIEQGASAHSMFILLEGEADVFVRVENTDTRVATLRTGDYCGEMSLLTGEPRSATVVAKSDCEMCEIEKNIIGTILQQNEGLVQKLGEILARRRMENEGILANTGNGHSEKREMEYTEGFLKRLSSFFEL